MAPRRPSPQRYLRACRVARGVPASTSTCARKGAARHFRPQPRRLYEASPVAMWRRGAHRNLPILPKRPNAADLTVGRSIRPHRRSRATSRAPRGRQDPGDGEHGDRRPAGAWPNAPLELPASTAEQRVILARAPSRKTGGAVDDRAGLPGLLIVTGNTACCCRCSRNHHRARTVEPCWPTPRAFLNEPMDTTLVARSRRHMLPDSGACEGPCPGQAGAVGWRRTTRLGSQRGTAELDRLILRPIVREREAFCWMMPRHAAWRRPAMPRRTARAAPLMAHP